MTITYDAEVDALYIRFSEATVTSRHLESGVTADYDEEGHLAGIEILDAAEVLGGTDSFRQIVLEDLAFRSSPAG